MPDTTRIPETINYGLYTLDDGYKEKTNLKNYVIEAQNFYNGNHYPNDNYKNMIRVTMNFCSFCSNLKAAKIVGTQRYITFTADNIDYDCTKLQRFDEYNIGKLDEKTEDFQAALDGFNNGTAISYYRWDADDTTYKGIYKGGLVLEQIDILRFAVANPYIKEIQRQKWVMFWNDEDVYAVREMLEREDKEEKKKVEKHIVPENYLAHAYEDYDPTSINHGLTTVYTRFFRIKGEVFFMCSTRNVDLFEYPHALSPLAEKSMKKYVKKIVDDYKKDLKENKATEYEKVCDYRIDYQDMIQQVADAQVMNEDEYIKIKEKFSLYPFASFVPYSINNSFYGRSEVKSMIPIQKGVNFALSMMLKCIENNAYNKIFVKEGTLQGQVITNEPNQVIEDHSRMTNGWGIKFAETQPLPNGVAEFTKSLFDMTRVVYGFNDVMDGSVSDNGISGWAVQQMIKQANSSIEQQQQLFWKYCKDKAAIRLMFYKFYVDKAKYTYELEDFEVKKKEEARKKLLNRQRELSYQGQSLEIGEDIDLTRPTKKVQLRNFEGKEIFGVSFDIGIDVMQGLADSKLVESQMWDTLIMNGNIQNMEPEMLELYLEANPTVSERTKAKLKAVVERQKQSENVQLKQKLQEAIGYIQKLLSYSKELEGENGYKTNYIDNLTKEFTEKIGVANKVITAQNKQLAQKPQVSDGEAKSKNARGMGGSDIAPSTVQ